MPIIYSHTNPNKFGTESESFWVADMGIFQTGMALFTSDLY